MKGIASRELKSALKFGVAAYLVQLILAALMFANVHFAHQAQGEIAWMIFMLIDSPSSSYLWDYLAPSAPFHALVDWGYTWGSGPNLRALVLHGLLGGIQWLVAVAALAFLWLRPIADLRHRR